MAQVIHFYLLQKLKALKKLLSSFIWVLSSYITPSTSMRLLSNFWALQRLSKMKHRYITLISLLRYAVKSLSYFMFSKCTFNIIPDTSSNLIKSNFLVCWKVFIFRHKIQRQRVCRFSYKKIVTGSHIQVRFLCKIYWIFLENIF